MEALRTFADVILYMEENHSNPKAFNYLEDGHWKHISTESFLFNLKRLTYGLISLGLKRGDKVGILAVSSPYWNMADFAIVLAGGVTVPLFDRISNETLIYETAQANIRYIFVQGELQWKMYMNNLSLFENVIALDDPPEEFPQVMKFQDVLQAGELLWEKKPKFWDELIHMLHGDDVATIIYTAGSMGMPKGVELTNQNLCHLLSVNIFAWDNQKDLYLSTLPMAHRLGSAGNHHVSFSLTDFIHRCCNGLQSGSTIAIHCKSRNINRKPPLNSNNPGNVGSMRRLKNISKDKFINLIGIQRNPCQ